MKIENINTDINSVMLQVIKDFFDALPTRSCKKNVTKYDYSALDYCREAKYNICKIFYKPTLTVKPSIAMRDIGYSLAVRTNTRLFDDNIETSILAFHYLALFKKLSGIAIDTKNIINLLGVAFIIAYKMWECDCNDTFEYDMSHVIKLVGFTTRERYVWCERNFLQDIQWKLYMPDVLTDDQLSHDLAFILAKK